MPKKSNTKRSAIQRSFWTRTKIVAASTAAVLFLGGMYAGLSMHSSQYETQKPPAEEAQFSDNNIEEMLSNDDLVTKYGIRPTFNFRTEKSEVRDFGTYEKALQDFIADQKLQPAITQFVGYLSARYAIPASISEDEKSIIVNTEKTAIEDMLSYYSGILPRIGYRFIFPKSASEITQAYINGDIAIYINHEVGFLTRALFEMRMKNGEIQYQSFGTEEEFLGETGSDRTKYEFNEGNASFPKLIKFPIIIAPRNDPERKTVSVDEYIHRLFEEITDEHSIAEIRREMERKNDYLWLEEYQPIVDKWSNYEEGAVHALARNWRVDYAKRTSTFTQEDLDSRDDAFAADQRYRFVLPLSELYSGRESELAGLYREHPEILFAPLGK